FQLLDQCGTQCGFDGFQVPGFQVRQDVFCCGEDLDEVLWHALHRSLFDLDGFGEQESQHICGLAQQVDAFLDQWCGLGEDVRFTVGELFAHEVAVLKIRNQPVAEVCCFQATNVRAVDCDGLLLIEACRVGQYVVDVEVCDKLFRAENVFVCRERPAQ